jgi:hypothetical protein
MVLAHRPTCPSRVPDLPIPCFGYSLHGDRVAAAGMRCCDPEIWPPEGIKKRTAERMHSCCDGSGQVRYRCIGLRIWRVNVKRDLVAGLQGKSQLKWLKVERACPPWPPRHEPRQAGAASTPREGRSAPPPGAARRRLGALAGPRHPAARRLGRRSHRGRRSPPVARSCRAGLLRAPAAVRWGCPVAGLVSANDYHASFGALGQHVG